MRFVKTMDSTTFDRGNYRAVQPGQWVKGHGGVKGQVAGVTVGGTVLVLWGAKVADGRLRILRNQVKP